MNQKNANVGEQLVHAAQLLREQLEEIDWTHAAPWFYNPLMYAWRPHTEYLRRFASEHCRVLFLGMNPGPWGMVQTGIPFGEVAAVRDWIGIKATAESPKREHPKRPILGLACNRSEVSGARLWGLFSKRFGNAEAFFQSHFVANYCPLAFMSVTASNVTPDKLPKASRALLEELCDEHLARQIAILQPEWLVGVGDFAEKCGRRIAANLTEVRVGKILHPSPASPAANRDWAGQATRQLVDLGIWNES